MTEHELKTWPEYFAVVISGAKTFEVRKNDRDYQPGDTLWLREWDPITKDYTGRAARYSVPYIFGVTDGGFLNGYIVMSLVAAGGSATPAEDWSGMCNASAPWQTPQQFVLCRLLAGHEGDHDRYGRTWPATDGGTDAAEEAESKAALAVHLENVQRETPMKSWTANQIRLALIEEYGGEDGYSIYEVLMEQLVAAVESPAQPPATHEHFGSGGSQWCDRCGESPDDPVHVQRGADTPQPDPTEVCGHQHEYGSRCQRAPGHDGGHVANGWTWMGVWSGAVRQPSAGEGGAKPPDNSAGRATPAERWCMNDFCLDQGRGAHNHIDGKTVYLPSAGRATQGAAPTREALRDLAAFAQEIGTYDGMPDPHCSLSHPHGPTKRCPGGAP